MRNIPHKEYLALLIEFDYEDFHDLKAAGSRNTTPYIQGKLEPLLCMALEQFLTWTTQTPSVLWAARRRELLHLFYHTGYPEISRLAEAPSLSHRVHELVGQDISTDVSSAQISNKLLMSESTLRRKLLQEGTSLQKIKDRARLGYGLHLIQTSMKPIGIIAENCGYASQSRFTERFKALFGVTPSELRKTRLPD